MPAFVSFLIAVWFITLSFVHVSLAGSQVASFDLATSLEPYFMAEYEIERAWEGDPAQLAALLQKHGIRNQAHFQQVRDEAYAYFTTDAAKAKYGEMNQIMQIKINATSNAMKRQQQARAQGEWALILKPIEGVSLQQWAGGQAKIAQGTPEATVLKELSIEKAKWARVSAQWIERMSKDTTFAVATEYSKAFLGAGQGKYGAWGKAAAAGMNPDSKLGDQEPFSFEKLDDQGPFSFEKWIEITQAMSVGVEQGKDAGEILAGYGLNAADWGTASIWWAQQFNANAMAMKPLHYRLSGFYRRKFSGQ